MVTKCTIIQVLVNIFYTFPLFIISLKQVRRISQKAQTSCKSCDICLTFSSQKLSKWQQSVTISRTVETKVIHRLFHWRNLFRQQKIIQSSHVGRKSFICRIQETVQLLKKWRDFRHKAAEVQFSQLIPSAAPVSRSPLNPCRFLKMQLSGIVSFFPRCNLLFNNPHPLIFTYYNDSKI